MSRQRVAIICGGRSSEHEISCISASGILGAIDTARYDPILIGITKAGDWRLLSGAADFRSNSSGLPEVEAGPNQLTISNDGIHTRSGEPLNIDLAFPVLHGAYGEDGTIQGLFEIANIAYVGSGVLASSVAMDKTFAKPIYADFGLTVAPGFTVHERDWSANEAMETAKVSALGFPLFIKPARSGSSRGTTKVKSANEIPAAMKAAHEHDPRALVEAAVVGREIECGVLEIGGVARASTVGEIRVHPPHEFYDFEAKYLDGSTSFDVPANLPAKLVSEIQEAAITAFTALGCEGLARVDFFITSDNKVTINELNTMPGFTPKSVYPMLWQASGIGYSELITTLCESALGRRRGVVR